VRSDNSSGFLLEEIVGVVEVAERADAGMEKPTTEDVGRALGFEGAAPSLRRSEAQEGLESAVFGAGLAGVGETGTSRGIATTSEGCCEEIGISSDWRVIAHSGLKGSVGLVCVRESVTESEVFVDTGEAGMDVSGAVEVAGVVSVAVESGISTWSGGVGVGA
jgi:hypothetical protein